MKYALADYYGSEKVILMIFVENTAVGEESSIIRENYEKLLESYSVPFSRQWADPVRRFLSLKAEWEANTSWLSTAKEICMHPAYQQIIGMGPVVTPLILSEIKKKPSHWFWALKSITGEDPILPEQRGRLKEMTEAWLRWGKEHGYLL